MAKPNPSFQKRQRERKKAERRQEKLKRRGERIAENERRRESLNGIDVTELSDLYGLADEEPAADAEQEGDEKDRGSGR